MTAAKKLANKGIDEKSLKKLIPLNTLSIDRLREIATKSSIESLPAARALFKFGDQDTKTYYLLTGEVEVQLPSGQNISVKSDTPAALHPLSDVRPRQATVVTKTNSTVLGVDRALLEILINDGHHSYEVNEIQSGNEADWITRFLQFLSVMSVPVKNIEQLMQTMEEYPVHAGDVVIRQADRSADHYFVVKEGRCAVTKQAAADKTPIRVAELHEGSGFGEEALLAQQPRGATVTMLTDGRLMRLSRSDFNRFIAEPVLTFVGIDEAKAMAASGAVWLDVRSDLDFRRGSLPGAINLPLGALRLKFRELNSYGKYIACADSPHRAAAAAFVLRQLGYSVAVLKQGLAEIAPPAGQPAAPAKKPTDSQELKTYGQRAVTGTESERTARESAAVAAAQRQLQASQADIDALRAEVAEAHQREQEARHQYARSQDSAKRDESSLREQSAQLQRKLMQLEQDRADKARELDRLKEELEQARKQAAQEVREMSQRAAQAVSQHVAEAQEEARVAQERANEFSLNLAATEAAHEATRKEVKNLQAELKRLRGEWKREQDEIAAAKEAQANEIARMKQNFDREQERKRAAEEALRSAESEAARLRAEADAARKRAEELSKRASETESKHANMLTEAKRKAEAAEALRRDAEEQARRMRDEAEHTRRRAEEEARRVAELEAAQRRAIEESERRAALADEIRRKADSEIARLKAEADAARREEEAQKRALAEEQARKLAESQARAKPKSATDSQRLKVQQAASKTVDDVDDIEQELARLQKKLEAKKRAALSRKEELEGTGTPDDDEPELQQNVYDISQKTQKLPAFKPNQGPQSNVGKVRKSGWVSDAILWETTLGLREDSEAESMLQDAPQTPAPADATPATPAAPTRRAESAPRANNSGEIKTKPTFTARDYVPNPGNRKVDVPVRRSNFGLIAAVAVAALAGGGIAIVATNSGEEPKSQAPAALEQRAVEQPAPKLRDELPQPRVEATEAAPKARASEEAVARTPRKAAPSEGTTRTTKPEPAAAAAPESKTAQPAPAKAASTPSAAPASAAPVAAPQHPEAASATPPSAPKEAPVASSATPEAGTTASPAASEAPQAVSTPPQEAPKAAPREFSDKAEVN